MGRHFFVFLFRQGTEQPHQGDVNNTMHSIPNTSEEVRYQDIQSRLTDSFILL
jgi:hypothetical protein